MVVGFQTPRKKSAIAYRREYRRACFWERLTGNTELMSVIFYNYADYFSLYTPFQSSG